MKTLPAALAPLKKIDQWLIWKNIDGKKVPHQATHPSKMAKSNNPKTWSTYEAARKAAAKADGIGFALPGSGIAAIDLDDCRDPKSGAIDAWAQDIIDRAMGAYIEVTPSEAGLRVIGLGKGPHVHTVRKMGRGKYELYRDADRYITISGRRIGKCERLTSIDKLIDHLKGEGEKKEKDRSRSGVLFAEICKLYEEGKTEAFAFRKLKPKGLHGDKGEEWLRGDIERGYAKLKAEREELENDDGVFERPLSEYREEKIEWLWYPFFPLNMVTCLEGEGEVGKSRLTRFAAATLSRGQKFPNEDEAHEPSAVLIASFSEDPVSSVVLPQVRKMGGDLDKVHVVEKPFTLDETGIAQLAEAMERVKPIAVILDPLSDYIPSKANSYKDEDVRRFVMGPLQKLAREHECAIIAIRHFRKSADGGAKYRGGGSIAFTNVARATVACVQDPEDENVTVMGVNKGNLVPRSKKTSLRFQIVETPDDIGELQWLGASKVTIEDLELLRQHKDRNPEQENDAKEFLITHLPVGEWMLVSKLKEHAGTRAFSWSTLERVSRMMGIEKKGGHRSRPAEWHRMS